MNQEIINRFNNLTDEEIRKVASGAHEFNESVLNIFTEELELRKMIDVKEEVIRNFKKYDLEFKNTPLNKSQIHFNVNSILLLLISTGPILDQIFHLSTFSRDPAPESTVLIMNLIFLSIYGTSFILFIKKHFWAKWISFSIYTLWTIVALLILMELKPNIVSILELVIRISILSYLINSHKWIMKYKKEQIN